MTTCIGKKIEGADAGFKPWPACGLSHVYIDGTIQLKEQHRIAPDQIESVTVFGGKRCQTLCQPLAARRRPATILDAKYNIIFPVAVAIARGDVVIRDFSEEGISDACVLALADKVAFRYDPRLEDPGSVPPGIVEIKLKTGKIVKRRVNLPYGHSSKPIPKEKLVAKFKDCAAHAARKISPKRISSVVKIIDRLEEIKNVKEVIDRVTPA
jgi:2-methylcitrate dehydratase PrpD